MDAAQHFPVRSCKSHVKLTNCSIICNNGGLKRHTYPLYTATHTLNMIINHIQPDTS